jgi:hypothetical protein
MGAEVHERGLRGDCLSRRAARVRRHVMHEFTLQTGMQKRLYVGSMPVRLCPSNSQCSKNEATGQVSEGVT